MSNALFPRVKILDFKSLEGGIFKFYYYLYSQFCAMKHSKILLTYFQQIRLPEFILGVILVLNSCSSPKFIPISRKASMQELTQRAIFIYLKTPNTLLNEVVGKGPIKLDPDLCRRDSLTILGKTYFNDPMYSPLVKHQKHQRKFKLIIPDSLTGAYIYTTKELDYKHDYATILQFSPLLSTHQKGIYFLELYSWFNMCDDEVCVRELTRSYLSFKVIDDDIFIQPEPPYHNQFDIIGFGPFYREKMDKAMPGEKIIRFRLEPKSRG